MNIQEIKQQIKTLQTEIDKLAKLVEEQEKRRFPFGTLYGKDGTNNVYTIFKDSTDGFIKILNITYGKIWQKQLDGVYPSNNAGWYYITYKQLYRMIGEDANKLFQLDKINIDNNSLTTKLTRNA